MVEQQIPLTVDHVSNIGFGNEMIVAFEPVISMLANECRIVASFDGAHVIDHSKQWIPVRPSFMKKEKTNDASRQIKCVK